MDITPLTLPLVLDTLLPHDPFRNVPITLTLHWETSPWTGFFNVFHASKYSQRSESFTFNLR